MTNSKILDRIIREVAGMKPPYGHVSSSIMSKTKSVTISSAERNGSLTVDFKCIKILWSEIDVMAIHPSHEKIFHLSDPSSIEDAKYLWSKLYELYA